MTLDMLMSTPRSPGSHFLILQKEGKREELKLEKGAWGRNKSQCGPGCFSPGWRVVHLGVACSFLSVGLQTLDISVALGQFQRLLQHLILLRLVLPFLRES